MIKKIVQIGDPVLENITSEITDVNDPTVKNLIKDLIDTCLSKEDITAGLSAPQIGVAQSVIVCRRMDLEDDEKKFISKENLWEVMINPKIIKASSKESSYWEGCLSVGVGPDGLYSPVNRPDTIDITYLSAKGEAKALKCKGFFAHIVQHEIDHLYGIVFLRYVEDPSSIWKSKDLDKYFDQYGEYPIV